MTFFGFNITERMERGVLLLWKMTFRLITVS